MVKGAIKKTRVGRFMPFSAIEQLNELAAQIPDVVKFDLTTGDHIWRNMGPLGVAVTSKKGKKWDALRESAAETGRSELMGAGIGAGAGAAAGAGILARNVSRPGLNGLAKRNLIREAAKAGKFTKTGVVGGLIGAHGGMVAGQARGNNTAKAREIQKKYHK